MHQRWGDKATRVFYNPLIGPRTRFENGYTVGRDAGALIVSTGQARLDGGVTGEVYQGPRQTDAPQWDMDGYLQSQTTVARRGRLIVGSYLPRYDADSGQVNWARPRWPARYPRRRSGRRRRDTPGRRLAERGQSGSADRGRQGKDRRRTGAGVRPGAGVLLYAPQVDIQAGIAAQGGRIQAGNVLKQVNDRGAIEDVLVRPATGKPVGVTLAAGATLDVSGLWTNAALDPAASTGLARRNGGQVALRSSGSIALGQGSLVDVSGGAAIQSGGKALAGRGGDLLLEAGSAGSPGVLALDGALAARGVDGGGKLTLQANQIRVVRAEQRGQAAPAGVSVLADSDFAQGFSQYELIGTRGLEVVEGARLRVSMPLLRLAPDAAAATDKTRALQAWTPPLYQEDAVKSVLTQRKGASLTLQSGTLQTAQTSCPRRPDAGGRFAGGGRPASASTWPASARSR